jgi:hypothetical protein
VAELLTTRLSRFVLVLVLVLVLMSVVLSLAVSARIAYAQAPPETVAPAPAAGPNTTPATTPAPNASPSAAPSTTATPTAPPPAEPVDAADSAPEHVVDPASLLPAVPSLPPQKASLIGGTVERMDRVRDELIIRVFGGGKMKIAFDPRTKILRNGDPALPFLSILF